MFRDAHNALAWAYETVNRPIVKMSGANRMREEYGRRTPPDAILGLSVHEQHAQAAAIIGMVERLADQAGREYISARFGRRLERDDLTILVYRGCEALGGGLVEKASVYRIMRSYFVGEMPYRTIRRMLGCRDRYALMVKSCLYDVLDVIHDRAMADMTEILEQHGLIQSTSSYA